MSQGKSRIVRQLAYATGGENPEKVQKPYNYEMISVHPNWHDSTELLGYVTRVSGNPEYIVTDFLKFIAKAWFYEGIPFFLCLDEMNLAPVEQYFAEYLSVVESRKLRNNKIVTDPIVPPLTTWDKADQKTLVSILFCIMVYKSSNTVPTLFLSPSIRLSIFIQVISSSARVIHCS